VNIQQGSFSGMSSLFLSEVINEAGFDNAFYYFRYDREVGDWAIVRELIFV